MTSPITNTNQFVMQKLTEEVERLQAELVTMRRGKNAWLKRAMEAKQQVESLKQENQRLRKTPVKTLYCRLPFPFQEQAEARHYI